MSSIAILVVRCKNCHGVTAAHKRSRNDGDDDFIKRMNAENRGPVTRVNDDGSKVKFCKCPRSKLGKKTAKERIAEAVQVALACGESEGAHHNRWVIDQMLRLLLTDKYESTIKKWNESNSDCDPWDCGIAP